MNRPCDFKHLFITSNHFMSSVGNVETMIGLYTKCCEKIKVMFVFVK